MTEMRFTKIQFTLCIVWLVQPFQSYMDKHTVSGKDRKTKVRVEEHSQTTLGYQVVAFKCFHMLSHIHGVFTSAVNREWVRGVRV